ncbi:hypothetical protein Clacol_005735 [Clathrus columnatus]|uniref:Uncharacterized protein n=1 Tax=Clathrus columnatus TaxID=1419009 RepID=A0AAV5AD25_9AGAM|nr:hypothetical protein Clacol_005735 [Clathrus columnatus]
MVKSFTASSSWSNSELDFFRIYHKHNTLEEFFGLPVEQLREPQFVDPALQTKQSLPNLRKKVLMLIGYDSKNVVFPAYPVKLNICGEVCDVRIDLAILSN